MTAVALPNVGIKAGYLPLEDGWGQDMNKNLRLLDALLQARVLDKDLATPPVGPASGDCYIVAATATGAWAGQSGKLAVWMTGDDLTGVAPIPAPAWAFVTPKSGWKVYVVDESLDYFYSGSAWAAITVVDTTTVAINNQTGTTYTLTLADAGKVVRQSNASAITTTVPTNASVAFPIGTTISLRQVGAGQITVSPAGGVTINGRTGYVLKSAAQGAVIMLHKVASDTWDATGDFATS